MKTINLTIPLQPYFPVGSVFPWESPYRTEDITSYELQSARLTYIVMGSDCGTRLIGPGLVSANAPKIPDLALDNLVNRYAMVLPIPKGKGDAITANDLDIAFEKAGRIRDGDAIFIATGWGDNKVWKTLGETFALNSPHFSLDGAKCLLSLMEQHKSNLLLTDCAYLDRIGNQYARQEWASCPPWLRPPWPSDQAKSYLRRYTREMVRADWAVTLTLIERIWAVVGLADCGKLEAGRVRLTCLPMFIQGAGEAPCTVVAEY